jgi:hypothetical protein
MEINPTPFIDQWSVTYIEYTAPTGQTARARIPGALGERVVRASRAGAGPRIVPGERVVRGVCAFPASASSFTTDTQAGAYPVPSG